MNRRGFFSTLAKAAAGFTILPAATTYSRIWRVQREPIYYINPEWTSAHFEYNFIFWTMLLKKTPFPPNFGDTK